MMNQQKPITDTHRCLSKSWAQGWELSFSILSSKSLCHVLKVISCLRCLVFVLPGPSSHIPWPWPLLRTAAQFNLPNAVMDQANQPTEKHWAPARYFQFLRMSTHLAMCHVNIGDIPVTQLTLLSKAVIMILTYNTFSLIKWDTFNYYLKLLLLTAERCYRDECILIFLLIAVSWKSSQTNTKNF